MGTLAVNAKYIDPHKINKIHEKRYKVKDVHAEDPKFKIPGNKPLIHPIKGAYPHMADYKIKYKTKTLNEEGNVLIGKK